MKMILDLLSWRILIHVLLLRPFLKLFFGVNIDGRENISRLNRYIIIANHNSHLDTALLFYSLPLSHIPITHPVACREYFSRSKIIFHLVNFFFSPVWIKRGAAGRDYDPLKEIKETLEKGHNVIIFPEGTRGAPGKIQHFKSGIGRLAEQYHNIPIVPVFLFGPERALPRTSSLPLPIWNNVIISPPQIFNESHIDITHTLEEIIRELSETETALRHKRSVKKLTPLVSIAVLGIDGSGKSTISRNISKLLSSGSTVALISDALKFYEGGELRQMQPILTENIRRAVGRYAKNASSLKLYKVPKLSELFLRDFLLVEVKKWYKPALLVLDGSPLLNLTAWAVLYKEEYFNESMCLKAIRVLSGGKEEEIAKNDPIYKEFPELSAIKKLRLNQLKIPDMVIFLDVEPDIAIERIERRGQKRQVHETKEKLDKLRNAYRITCNVLERDFNIPTHIIPGNDSMENITLSAFNFIKKHLRGENSGAESED